MARLWLVRHGEAEAGWERRDPGLSAAGRAQAEAVGVTLEPVGPVPLLVSPLRRTRETAAPLARRWGVEPGVEPAVGELVAPTDDLDERVGWLRRVLASTWAGLDERDRAWRDSVVRRVRQVDTDTVVVTHFVAINVAVGAATGDDRVVTFAPDTGSVTVLETTQDGLELVTLGDQRPLGGGTHGGPQVLTGERPTAEPRERP